MAATTRHNDSNWPERHAEATLPEMAKSAKLNNYFNFINDSNINFLVFLEIQKNDVTPPTGGMTLLFCIQDSSRYSLQMAYLKSSVMSKARISML